MIATGKTNGTRSGRRPPSMTWTSPADARENIRNQLFKKFPRLEQEIKYATTRLLTSTETAEKNRDYLIRIRDDIVVTNFKEISCSRARLVESEGKKWYTNKQAVLEECFPEFLTHPFIKSLPAPKQNPAAKKKKAAPAEPSLQKKSRYQPPDLEPAPPRRVPEMLFISSIPDREPAAEAKPVPKLEPKPPIEKRSAHDEPTMVEKRSTLEQFRNDYAQLASGIVLEGNEELSLASFKDREVTRPDGTRFSMKKLLREFFADDAYYWGWESGRHRQRRGKHFTSMEEFGVFLELVIHPEETKVKLANEVETALSSFDSTRHHMRRIDYLKRRSALLIKYGEGIFVDLFRMNYKDYLNSLPPQQANKGRK